MKSTLSFLAVSMMLTTSSFAKIVHENGMFYVEGKQGRNALMNVNDMVKKKSISKVKVYGEGKANLISFAKDSEPMKLYSVDEKGFIYTLEPFSKYTVTDVYADGKFRFKEEPKRKYTVSPKGFFLY